MWPWSVHYQFDQGLPRPAAEAFEWCTDYQPGDLALMGESGERSVRWLTKEVVLLTDRFDSRAGKFVKRKLVHLYPSRLFWTSTHLSGPARNSQFFYDIRPTEKNVSRLHFTGLQFEYRQSRPNSSSLQRFAERLRREDSQAWHQIAKAMAGELA